jgi:dihydrofolate reductase
MPTPISTSAQPQRPGAPTLPEMDLVLAVDAAWGIGRDNALPWPKLSADLRHFKDITSAAASGQRNAVIMGRRTWESKEVGGKPLPRRINLVLSRQPLQLPDGVVSVTSLDAALDHCAKRQDVDQVFIIGGAEIYRLALVHPRCRAVYITRIAGTFGCDAVVPNLDQLCDPDPSWPVRQFHEHGIDYTIARLMLKPRPQT